MDFLKFVFDGSLMPHGHCLMWRTDLLFLHLAGDIATVIAYFAIPIALVILVRNRHDTAFNRTFLLFAAFILLCGITHLFAIINIWCGYYFLHGLAKFFTGLISVITAIIVWRLLPIAVHLPSNSELNEKVRQLEEAEIEMVIVKNGLEEQVAQRTEELELMTRIDQLTDVLNRRGLLSILDSEMLRYNRYQEAFCVLMIDLDNFKKINDTYGHNTGDDVLVHAAKILRELSRATDSVGRFGGEEFVVLLPNTGLDDARHIAERYRTSIAGAGIESEGHTLSVTCSIGVAMVKIGQTTEDLLHDADQAMYTAKNQGKNQVVTA